MRTSAFSLLLDQSQFVPVSIGALQKQRCSTARQLAVRDDGDAISQKVGFIHMMGGEQDGPAWSKGTKKQTAAASL